MGSREDRWGISLTVFTMSSPRLSENQLCFRIPVMLPWDGHPNCQDPHCGQLPRAPAPRAGAYFGFRPRHCNS
jgi:hypothetical protein